MGGGAWSPVVTPERWPPLQGRLAVKESNKGGGWSPGSQGTGCSEFPGDPWASTAQSLPARPHPWGRPCKLSCCSGIQAKEVIETGAIQGHPRDAHPA